MSTQIQLDKTNDDVKEIIKTPVEKPAASDPIKKDTAAHGDDDRMSKKAQS